MPRRSDDIWLRCRLRGWFFWLSIQIEKKSLNFFRRFFWHGTCDFASLIWCLITGYKDYQQDYTCERLQRGSSFIQGTYCVYLSIDHFQWLPLASSRADQNFFENNYCYKESKQERFVVKRSWNERQKLWTEGRVESDLSNFINKFALLKNIFCLFCLKIVKILQKNVWSQKFWVLDLYL